MKAIKSIVLLTLWILTASIIALGQDAPATALKALTPTPAPEPQSSPKPAATPAPASSPSPVSSPAPALARPPAPPITPPRPTPQARPSPKISPKASAKPDRASAKSTPKREKEPKARPPARASRLRFSDQMELAEKLKQLENKWEDATARGDASFLEEIIADDFVGTGSEGRVGNKSRLLSEVRRDRSTYTTAVARDLHVTFYGTDVAIVIGVAKQAGKNAAGKSFSRTQRFTDTWMMRDGQWQCIASHSTLLPKE